MGGDKRTLTAMTTKRRGRPPISPNASAPRHRDRYLRDLEIARAVYESVLCGKPYRDGVDEFGALSDGVRKAEALGVKLTQDGVEALIERMVRDTDGPYRQSPTSLRNMLSRFKAGFCDSREATLKVGRQTRRVKVEPFVPSGDGDLASTGGPTLKIRKNPPGN